MPQICLKVRHINKPSFLAKGRVIRPVLGGFSVVKVGLEMGWMQN